MTKHDHQANTTSLANHAVGRVEGTLTLGRTLLGPSLERPADAA